MADNKTTGEATQASAPSQAQTTSSEPDQIAKNDPQALADQRSEADVAEETGKAGAEAAIQHFEGSIAKVNADGDQVLSDHLAPGERLARDTQAPGNLTNDRNPGASAKAREADAAGERREAARNEAMRNEAK